MIVACLMYYSLSALWCLRGSVLICHWPRTPKVGNTSPFSIFVQGLSWVRLSWSCYSQQTQKCELAPQRTRQICIFVMMQSSHCHKDLVRQGDQLKSGQIFLSSDKTEPSGSLETCGWHSLLICGPRSS